MQEYASMLTQFHAKSHLPISKIPSLPWDSGHTIAPALRHPHLRSQVDWAITGSPAQILSLKACSCLPMMILPGKKTTHMEPKYWEFEEVFLFLYIYIHVSVFVQTAVSLTWHSKNMLSWDPKLQRSLPPGGRCNSWVTIPHRPIESTLPWPDLHQQDIMWHLGFPL